MDDTELSEALQRIEAQLTTMNESFLIHIANHSAPPMILPPGLGARGGDGGNAQSGGAGGGGGAGSGEGGGGGTVFNIALTPIPEQLVKWLGEQGESQAAADLISEDETKVRRGWARVRAVLTEQAASVPAPIVVTIVEHFARLHP